MAATSSVSSSPHSQSRKGGMAAALVPTAAAVGRVVVTSVEQGSREDLRRDLERLQHFCQWLNTTMVANLYPGTGTLQLRHQLWYHCDHTSRTFIVHDRYLQ
jgi:hypothetical protein